MRAEPRTEESVKALLEKMNQAYAQKDTNALMSCYSRDGDLVVLGTGKHEKYLGPAEFKAGLILGDFAQADKLQSKFTWMSVSASGPVAWVSADMQVTAEVKGQIQRFDMRFTAVLERVMGRWLIMQSHFSLPAAGQAAGQSFPAR